MFRAIEVVGRGRVGSALAARLDGLGLLAEGPGADLVVLAVPDAAIAEVARVRPAGAWMAHMSGATPLASLDPHPPSRRFSLHPLQTFVRSRGAEQFDGAWGAVTAESDDARAHARWLAMVLGLRPFDLADEARALYHAGAAMASNAFVTLHHAAARIVGAAGVPPEALLPLMQRTMDNHFELTGPIARGDHATIAAHVAALRRDLPEFEGLYQALVDATPRDRQHPR